MYICRSCGGAGVKPYENYDKATGRMERSCGSCEGENLLYLPAELYGNVANVLDDIAETMMQNNMTLDDVKRVIGLWLTKKEQPNA